MTNMRRGFTMIELIFVIVIIGILAAVAIPKLAANRTDAQAAVCVHEAGQLLSEISAQYTKLGYTDFITKKTSDMTNIHIGAKTAGINGIPDVAINGTGGAYYCDGVDVVSFAGSTQGTDYRLRVTYRNVRRGSPAAVAAAAEIRKNMLNGATRKDFLL